MNHPFHIDGSEESFDYGNRSGERLLIESLTPATPATWACFRIGNKNPKCFHEPVAVWAMVAVYAGPNQKYAGDFQRHEIIGLVTNETTGLFPPADNFLAYVDTKEPQEVCDYKIREYDEDHAKAA